MITDLAKYMLSIQMHDSATFKNEINSYKKDNIDAKSIMSQYFIKLNKGAALAAEIEAYHEILKICVGLNKYPEFMNNDFTISQKTIQNNNDYKTKNSIYGKTYNSFSGCDMIAYIMLPPDISDGKPIAIGNLQTISYSIHREVNPVRKLGSINPEGFCSGNTTIAGSLIFTMFDHNLVYKIQKKLLDYLEVNQSKSQINNNYYEYNQFYGYNAGNLRNQYVNMSMMPPFDIFVAMRNEYTPSGAGATLLIEGVVIVDEGQVMSIEDMITENTMSYMAKNIRPLYDEGAKTYE